MTVTSRPHPAPLVCTEVVRGAAAPLREVTPLDGHARLAEERDGHLGRVGVGVGVRVRVVVGARGRARVRVRARARVRGRVRVRVRVRVIGLGS